MKRVMSFGLSCLLCTAPSFALAGAWPRGEGKVFIAASAELTWPQGRSLELPDIYGSLYFEYGINSQTTLGLDIGSADITKNDRLKAVAFARYTLTSAASPYQIALDFGVGTSLGQPVVRLGASYGKGIMAFGRQSWISIDAHSLIATRCSEFATSIDATFGVSIRRGKIIGQISAFQAFDRSQSISFAPSFAYDLGKGRHLEVGARVGLLGKPDPALKIGIWQEF